MPVEWSQKPIVWLSYFKTVKVLFCRAVLLLVPCSILNTVNSTKAPPSIERGASNSILIASAFGMTDKLEEGEGSNGGWTGDITNRHALTLDLGQSFTAKDTAAKVA